MTTRSVPLMRSIIVWRSLLALTVSPDFLRVLKEHRHHEVTDAVVHDRLNPAQRAAA